MSAYDDDFERARAARELADAAAQQAIDALVVPDGPAAARFWSEVKRLATEQVWPTVDDIRSKEDPPTWRELGWLMETTEATMRNAHSRWRSRDDKAK